MRWQHNKNPTIATNTVLDKNLKNIKIQSNRNDSNILTYNPCYSEQLFHTFAYITYKLRLLYMLKIQEQINQ